MRKFTPISAFAAMTLVVLACGSEDPTTSDNLPDGGSLTGYDAGSPGLGSDGATNDAGGPTEQTYSVGGFVTGLSGTGLVLQDNGGDDLPVAKDGSFQFSKKLAKGASFKVTIRTQPSAPTQTCTVSGDSGVVGAGNVTSVVVNCASDKFTVGGTVSGLAGSGLVLQDNGGADLVVNANGSFAFATTVASGQPYAVTVKTQPSNPSQTCAVTSGTGTMGGSNVTNVQVVCTTNKYTVGGTVSGLAGTGLVLKNNGETLPVAANGTFTFPTSVASGSAFAVTVGTQPSTPAQTCVVSGGTGTIGSGNVTSVAVNCTTNKYTVGGTASGLAGTAVLQINGAGDLNVSANGAFAFAQPLDSGTAYTVTIKTQPGVPSQTCTLGNEMGKVAAANVTNVTLTCVTNKFKVKGTVSGLVGAGLVLRDNGGDDLSIAANGAFEFTTAVDSGKTYSVTAFAQPSGPSQTCTVTNGSGTVGAADVTNVAVTCTTNSYTVGGMVTGLTGSGLVLRDNGGDDLAVPNAGAFTFATKVLSGNPYVVTVKTQPTNPTQTCTVSAGSGTVTNGNVVSIAVNCTTNSYTVGGNVSGLAGTGLVLTNNGGNDLTVNQNGSFAFGTPVLSGAAYSVAVKTQPTNPSQTCTVASGAGTVGGANVTSVAVTCTTNSYTVGGAVSGLTAGTLVLQDNGADDLSIVANGPFTFVTKVLSGAAYAVTVKTQPLNLSCSVTSGTGTMAGANVTNVAVTCVPQTSWGPVHTFNGVTSDFFISTGQGCCSVNCAGNAAVDAAYFCTHFYGQPLGKTCTPRGVYIQGTYASPSGWQMHKNGGCTTAGNDIPNLTCDPLTTPNCKIWNTTTAYGGLRNLICDCQ